jgi:threonine dehydratase
MPLPQTHYRSAGARTARRPVARAEQLGAAVRLPTNWSAGSDLLVSPCIRSAILSELCGCDIHVKLENLQATGSFKERGALAKLTQLTRCEREKGVVAASAGNHAQGVARHGVRLGIQTTIFMPLGTPNVKVSQTRKLGAEVRLCGADYDEANDLAQSFCQQKGAVFVPAFDDPVVAAGQGSIATEMLMQNPDIDTLVIPIGGGGLAAGMSLAARSIRPDMTIIGVQSRLFPSAYNAFHGVAEPVGGITLAEGIAVRSPGRYTTEILKAQLDDIVLVDEPALERALNIYLSSMHILPEGAGAIGLAGVLENQARFTGRNVGLVLTGGNIDPRLLSSLLLRDLARTRRLARLRIELVDVPGQLADVSRIIADSGGNITDVAYHKTFSDLPAKVTNIDISLEAQDAVHMDRIHTTLSQAGFTVGYADY